MHKKREFDEGIFGSQNNSANTPDTLNRLSFPPLALDEKLLLNAVSMICFAIVISLQFLG